MDKKKQMVTVSQLFKSLILAQIIANITPSLANISNGLLIGNSLSPTAMAALSFVAPTGGLFAAIASVISLGANILCGNYMGRGENEKVEKVFTTAIVSLLAIGGALTLYTECFTENVASLLGAEGEALPETIEYLRGLCLGIIPTLLVPCLVVFLNMANEIMHAMISTLVLAIVNLLVGFVNLRLMQGGMVGMGLASAISEAAAFVFLLYKFIKKKDLVRLKKDGFVPGFVLRIIVLGSPSALMFFLYSIRNIQINTLTFDVGGTQAVTALGILSSSAGIFDAVNTGIGSTLVMLASVMAGEEDRESLKKLAYYALTFGGILVILKTGLFAALAHPIVNIFAAEGTDKALAVKCIYYYAACMPFNLIPMVLIKTYQCLNRVFFSNVCYVFTCIIFPIGIMRVLGPIYGIDGVWTCYYLTEIFTILMLFIVCFIKSGRFPKTMGDWLWLNKTFEVLPDNQLSATISNENEIEDICLDIREFLIKKGIGLEKSAQAETYVEKIADYIINGQNISGPDKKKKYPEVIDILASIKEDELLIRFRDNYVPCDSSEEIRNNIIGAGDIKELKYQLTFGMNILSLKM